MTGYQYLQLLLLQREKDSKNMASAMGKGSERNDLQIFFFLNVQQRFRLRIPVTPEFTGIVSGHGKTRAYLTSMRHASYI